VFETVLVANRGEIAYRIIRTLKRMGVRAAAVYSDADAGAPHVLEADVAVRLGEAPPDRSYLNVDAVLAAADKVAAQAVHPGYGFLSESSSFAGQVERAGLVFIGPTPEQLAVFGDKHRARQSATTAGVPLLPGSGVLADIDEAVALAHDIGFPVMLKSTAGGGGIGMERCDSEPALRDAFARVARLAESHFGSGDAYLERVIERARHVEVQIFGDGNGRVLTLGDRDCSWQRRNQKVVEEAPAPRLSESTRESLAAAALRLGELVAYRSAGTVEFLVDAENEQLSFLEVNARLQVEHPVTEMVWGVDLVEWMVRLAAGDDVVSEGDRLRPRGHAIEARIYAEDPARDYRPNAGLLTEVAWPPNTRCDTWVETGTELTSYYDPLIAKVVVYDDGDDRQAAVALLQDALGATRVAGIETNLTLLQHVAVDERFVDGRPTTTALATVSTDTSSMEVIAPGSMTTVQDLPGRLGYWAVGVPPSGPMDDRSFRLGNLVLGNAPGAPGLEITATGPTLRFAAPTTVCLTGAAMPARLDGIAVAFWEPVRVSAGSVLELGVAPGPGMRAYLLVEGGFDVPDYLGSASTFTLGRFGGHGGRALRTGDVLHLAGTPREPAHRMGPVPESDRPPLTNEWSIGTVDGPHGDREFLAEGGLRELLDAEWTVHFNSARTGIRLLGPRPKWARPDGGDAGLHPSNIHDTPYAVGAVDLTGDMPIILGPDGPSLGGFVCPIVVVSSERWKLGQLRPGDRVRFASSTPLRARRAVSTDDPGVLQRSEPTSDRPAVAYRRSGDDYLLVEYGDMVLDLDLRFRVHALGERLAADRLEGLIDLTPGIRSLQLHLDPALLSVERAVDVLRSIEDELPAADAMEVPSRVVHLPLSWDDPSTREAIARYMDTVRNDAPWCPWNIEFIRRINGLASVDAVHDIVFGASYLVLGLGDVYLGAPVATPLDPRHRLVTTKYNPARTWTPENAVGIGGAYLCVYGMEGPGGYQFVGRTVPVWNRFKTTRHFEPGRPWLLRFFDQIRWYEVSADTLLEMRQALMHDRLELDIETTTLRLGDHHRFLAAHEAEIATFRERQQAAFRAERTAWEESGELDAAERVPEPPPASRDAVLPAFAHVVEAPLAAAVWQVTVAEGDEVAAGDTVVVLEAMKMETPVVTTRAGRVAKVLVAPGDLVDPGRALIALDPS
jgi:urea carboxylase